MAYSRKGKVAPHALLISIEEFANRMGCWLAPPESSPTGAGSVQSNSIKT